MGEKVANIGGVLEPRSWRENGSISTQRKSTIQGEKVDVSIW